MERVRCRTETSRGRGGPGDSSFPCRHMAQDPLHLLCIEPAFPGRLGAVADWLVRRRGYRCQFYCHTVGPQETWPEAVGRGLDVIGFNVGGVAREAAVEWTRV